MRQPHDFGPALNEPVVSERIHCALLALAQGVEAIGQLAGDLGLGAQCMQRRGGALAAGTEHTNQLVDDRLRGEAWIGSRVPVSRQFVWLEQPHLAPF